MANFKIEGRLVWWKLIDYLKQLSIQEGNFDESYMMKFIKNVLILKIEPSEKEIEKFETKLETAFDLFIQDLQTRGFFSEMKEDYFKI